MPVPVPHQPDKPQYIPEKSPREVGGTGMGRGAILFIFILIASLIVSFVILQPIVEQMEFPDIGISYSTLFLLFIGIAILVSICGVWKGGMVRGHYSLRYKERDPSICSRVIKDGYDGREFIITGAKEDTFEETLRANWPFEDISEKSKWYIKDEKGNDVTDRSLETVEGIFYLIPEYGSEPMKEEPDSSDEYSSIHDSVTYYD